MDKNWEKLIMDIKRSDMTISDKCLAIEAVEKQIPKLPHVKYKNEEFDGNFEVVCPCCHTVLMRRVTTKEKSEPFIFNPSNVCVCCGQRLNRSRRLVTELERES